MLLSDFQKHIIRKIAEGKISNIAHFLMEICYLEQPPELGKMFADGVRENMIDYHNIGADHFFYVYIPQTPEKALGMLVEYVALLNILEHSQLILIAPKECPDQLHRLRFLVALTEEDRKNHVNDTEVLEGSELIRERAGHLLIPMFSELRAFIDRGFKTQEEKNLESEKWHRNAQFCIALIIALVTSVIGIITVWQNTNNERQITIKNTRLLIDTAIVKIAVPMQSNRSDSTANQNIQKKP